MPEGNQSVMQVTTVGSGKPLPTYRSSKNGKQDVEEWHAKNEQRNKQWRNKEICLSAYTLQLWVCSASNNTG